MKILKSNASQNDYKEIVSRTKCTAGQVFVRKQDLPDKMRRRPDFSTECWWIVCPIDIVCNTAFLDHSSESSLRVEFLLKTYSGYPKDTGVNKPWQPLRIPSAITPIGQLHQSPPSPIPGDLGRGPSHQSTCSNIETRMDRPKSVVRVIRGVA